MRISEFMTNGVELISADSTLKVAAEAMKANRIGALPVQEEGVLQGMLTSEDIVTRAIAEGLDPGQTLVSDIMTPQLFTCFSDQDVDEVIKIMKDRQVHHVVVLNSSENPVGMVSLGDIAAHAQITVTALAPEPAPER